MNLFLLKTLLVMSLMLSVKELLCKTKTIFLQYELNFYSGTIFTQAFKRTDTNMNSIVSSIKTEHRPTWVQKQKTIIWNHNRAVKTWNDRIQLLWDMIKNVSQVKMTKYFKIKNLKKNLIISCNVIFYGFYNFLNVYTVYVCMYV